MSDITPDSSQRSDHSRKYGPGLEASQDAPGSAAFSIEDVCENSTSDLTKFSVSIKENDVTTLEATTRSGGPCQWTAEILEQFDRLHAKRDRKILWRMKLVSIPSGSEVSVRHADPNCHR
jgi:hypothetical protein